LTTKKQTGSPAIPQLIERRIYTFRGQKVMIDSDLAELYQVTTGNLAHVRFEALLVPRSALDSVR